METPHAPSRRLPRYGPNMARAWHARYNVAILADQDAGLNDESRFSLPTPAGNAMGAWLIILTFAFLSLLAGFC